MKRLWSAVVIWTLVGCGGGEEKSSDYLPDVPVECTTAQAADCGGTNLSLFIGWIAETATACDDLLTGMNANQRRSTFLASGQTTAVRQGIFLAGTVTSWVNDLGGRVDVLAPGPYTVCACIDSNANGVIDANEPVAQGRTSPGRSDFVLRAWSPAYN